METFENKAENSLIPASASHLVPKTVTFCQKIELNALPCNFPSENGAVLLLRPKKAIPGAEFNTVWIQTDKKSIYALLDENAKDDEIAPASIFAATIFPGAASGAHLHREADMSQNHISWIITSRWNGYI